MLVKYAIWLMPNMTKFCFIRIKIYYRVRFSRLFCVYTALSIYRLNETMGLATVRYVVFFFKENKYTGFIEFISIYVLVLFRRLFLLIYSSVFKKIKLNLNVVSLLVRVWYYGSFLGVGTKINQYIKMCEPVSNYFFQYLLVQRYFFGQPEYVPSISKRSLSLITNTRIIKLWEHVATSILEEVTKPAHSSC